MAENISIRGHETRTYLCACHPGFLFSNNHKYMQEIKLQPFIQEVLQKNTYNSPRNNHANPSCNTFLQEKHHKCQKSLPSTSAHHLIHPNTQERAPISDLTNEWVSCDHRRMRVKTLNIYCINDLIYFLGHKKVDKAIISKLYCFYIKC